MPFSKNWKVLLFVLVSPSVCLCAHNNVAEYGRREVTIGGSQLLSELVPAGVEKRTEDDKAKKREKDRKKKD